MIMENWDVEFEDDFDRLSDSDKHLAGILLHIVPKRAKWEEFKKCCRAAWPEWHNELADYKYCLIVLFTGVAFFDYDDSEFWPHFFQAVGVHDLPANQQTELKSKFAKYASDLGLKVLQHEHSTAYVGTAVFYAGIPLSLWSHFISICEWAFHQDDWNLYSDQDWKEIVKRRTVNIPRLHNFLISNRKTAHEYIQAMLDARKSLLNDHKLTLDDVLQSNKILRQEYLEDIPETAEFLRPSNPDSLLKDKIRLVWSGENYSFNLQLPGVASNKLPAFWQIFGKNIPASTNPDISCPIDSKAFTGRIDLALQTNQGVSSEHVPGINNWGLISLDDGVVVKGERDNVPVGNYAIISQSPVQIIKKQGFISSEDAVENEEIELNDGCNCYLTRLSPTTKRPFIRIKCNNVEKTIQFTTRDKIVVGVFFGKGSDATNYLRVGNLLKMEKLPLICVQIPEGFFLEPFSVLHTKFKLTVDSSTGVGRWGKLPFEMGGNECFIWEWNKQPIQSESSGTRLKSLSELKEWKPLELKGKHSIRISSGLGTHGSFDVELVNPNDDFRDCFKNLPGKMLPFSIISQKSDGMTWDDIMLARSIISKDGKLYFRQLCNLADHGLLRKSGRKWFIGESRAAVEVKDVSPSKNTILRKCTVEFCGDLSYLWGLYRYIMAKTPKGTRVSFPQIEIMTSKGFPPHCHMHWGSSHMFDIVKYFKNHGVKICQNSIWSH